MSFQNFYNSDLGQSHWLYGTQGNALKQEIKQEVVSDFINQSYLDGVLTTLTVTTPTTPTDAVNKSYVDGLTYLSTGTGLTKSGSILSVDSSQPLIIATPTTGSHATNKTYVDTLGYLTAGTGLTKTSSTLSVNASQTQITTIGTLTSLSITGALSGSTATFSGIVTGVTPVSSNDLTTKAYVDNAITSSQFNTAGDLYLTSTTASSSTSTGALKVSGGVGVAGSLYSSFITSTATTDSTSINTGSLTVKGGLGVAKSFFCGNASISDGTSQYTWQCVSNNYGVGTLIGNQTAGNTLSRLNIGSTIPTGDYTSVLRVYRTGFPSNGTQSNLAIEANPTNNKIYMVTSGSGTAVPLEIYGAMTFGTTGNIAISTTTSSTSNTTGALTVAGGLGVSGYVYIQGAGSGMTVSSIGVSDTTDSDSTTTGCVVLSGGMAIAKTLYANSLNIPSTTNSTSTTTGSVQIAGGVGLAKDLYVGASGSIIVNNTADATSTSTGAVRIAGGLSVTRSIYSTADMTLYQGTPSATRTLSLAGNGGVGSINQVTFSPWLGRSGGASSKIVCTDDNSGSYLDFYNIHDGTQSSSATLQMRIDSASGVRVNNYLIPHQANTYMLGTNALPWLGGYTVNGMSTTSDKRMKQDIREMDSNETFELIDKLRPVHFRWKDIDGLDSNKIHSGFIAQDVAHAVGKDNALVNVPDAQECIYTLNKDELIGYLVKAVQELKSRIEKLEK